MTLTIEHNGQLYLNPKSLEFWRLLPNNTVAVAMNPISAWNMYYNIPIKCNHNWSEPQLMGWVLNISIHHPGTWEDSLYIRPELATESTPEGTLVITWNMIDNCYYTRGYLKNWAYNITPIIATDAMKRQYLGE